MQSQQPMRGPHKAHRAPAGQGAFRFQLIAHHLRNRQLSNRLRERFLQAFSQSRALGRAFIKQRLSLTIHHALQACHCARHSARIHTKRLQLFRKRRRCSASSIQAHSHRHQLLRDRLICSLCAHITHMRSQTARRSKARKPRFDCGQALRFELIKQDGRKCITQLPQSLRRQFFNK